MNQNKFFSELNHLIYEIDRKVTDALENKKYIDLSHSNNCLLELKQLGYYKCFREDKANNVAFDITRKCKVPPVPCGWPKRDGSHCRRTRSHVHIEEDGYVHRFYEREEE